MDVKVLALASTHFFAGGYFGSSVLAGSILLALTYGHCIAAAHLRSIVPSLRSTLSCVCSSCVRDRNRNSNILDIHHTLAADCRCAGVAHHEPNGTPVEFARVLAKGQPRFKRATASHSQMYWSVIMRRARNHLILKTLDGRRRLPVGRAELKKGHTACNNMVALEGGTDDE